MKFGFLQGKNYKDFVVISDITTKDDLKMMEIIRKTLTRSEYNHFMKGFNKNITYSYLFNDSIFPYQFWDDVTNAITPFIGSVELINEPVIKLIDEDYYNKWLNSINIPDDIFLDKEEYFYQQESIYMALNKRVARVEIATSGGKTFITYLYCKYIIDHKLISEKSKILIIVPSQLLAKQLKDDFKYYDSKNNFEDVLWVETIYSSAEKVYGANVVCGTYQSLCNYDEDYFDGFEVMICDELHRAKAYSIRNAIYAKIKNAKFIFGMTGTFPDYKTLDYLHITSMFGPEVINVSARQLIDSGVANNVIIQSVTVNYLKDGKSLNNIYDVIDKDLIGTEKYLAEKSYFQRNTERTHLLTYLLNRFEDNSILLVDTVEYCDVLYNYLIEKCPNKHFEIIHGKVKNRDEIINAMRNCPKNFVIIGTFGTMSTGISIKNLTHAYIIDSGKSPIRMRQSLGRLMRIIDGKNTSYVFDFKDNIRKSTFKSHAMERLKTYKKMKLDIKETTVNINVKDDKITIEQTGTN